MELEGVIHTLVGSTFGLILRLFIKYNVKRSKLSFSNNSFLVNNLASLFLGILIALNLNNKNLLLLFFVGFLGSFSTFSSFIYQLFNYIQKRKYLNLLIYYVEVLVLSFLFFCLGHFITLILQNE